MTDYGSECTFDLSWQIADNLKWKTRLWGYTTYKRAEIEWENTITFQFNRYISTNIFLYPRFDDGAKRKDDQSYWQFKEFMSSRFLLFFLEGPPLTCNGLPTRPERAEAPSPG